VIFHYSGVSGQSEFSLTAVVERIVIDPSGHHHLWQAGWTGWKVWTEVREVCVAVELAQHTASEDPTKVAEYERVLHEMLADGVLEAWESDVLANLRRDYGISQSTHDRLATNFVPIQSQLLGMAVDRSTIADFRASQNCMLRMQVRNEGSDALRHVRYELITSSTQGSIQGRSGRLAPRGDDQVMVRLTPEIAGQHHLEGLLTAVTYSGVESRYRLQPFMFAVASPHSAGAARVFNIDASAMRVGKFEGLGDTGGQAGGLLGRAQWVQVRLNAITEQEANDWRLNHGIAPEAPKPPDPVRAARGAPTTPGPLLNKTPVVYHYQGATGQAQHPEDSLVALIAAAQDQQHFLWRPGWSGWKAWSDVPEIAAAVAASAPSAGYCYLAPRLLEGLDDRLAPDRVVLDDDPDDADISLPGNGDIRLIDGVDGAALARAGCCNLWSYRQGRLLAHTSILALVVGERWADLAACLAGLSAHDPRMPVLRALAEGRRDAARGEVERVSGRFPRLTAAIRGALGDRTGAAAALERTPFSEGVRAASVATLWVRCVGDEARARSVIEAGERDDPNNTEVYALAAARLNILDDEDGARSLLEGANSGCEDRTAWHDLAGAWMRLFGDEKKTLRCLTRASAHDADCHWEWAAEARCWRALLDDAEEARKLLQKGTDAAHADGDCDFDDWEDLAPAWLNLFGDQRRFLRAMEAGLQSADVTAEFLRLARIHLHGFGDAAEARAVLTRAEGEAKGSDDWIAVAKFGHELDDDRRVFRSLERARGLLESEDEGVTDWLDMAKAWMTCAGDVGEARSCVQKAVNSGDVALVKVAAFQIQYLADTQTALRTMARAERACSGPLDWKKLATVWREDFSDVAEARRCLEAATAAATESSAKSIIWRSLARAWRELCDDERQATRCQVKSETAADREKQAKATIGKVRDLIKKYDAAVKSRNWSGARTHHDAVVNALKGVTAPSDVQSTITRQKRKLADIGKKQAVIEKQLRDGSSAVSARNWSKAITNLEAAYAAASFDPALRKRVQTKLNSARTGKANADQVARARASQTRKANAQRVQKTTFEKKIKALEGKGCHIATSSDRKQSWCRSSAFPGEYIDYMRTLGLWITHLKHGLGEWMVVMSTVPRYKEQVYKSGSMATVKAFVTEYWNKDWYITSYDVKDDTNWAAVLTKGTGWKEQKYCWKDKFAKDHINEAWGLKRNVTSLGYGGTKWRTVTSRYGTGYRQQTWATRNSYAGLRDWIREKWKEQYCISHFAYGNKLWGAVLDKNSGLTRQTYKPCKGIAAAKTYSKEKWAEGRRITEIGPDDDSWWLIFGKHADLG